MSLYNNGTKMPSPHEAANGFPQPSASGTWHKPEEEVRLVEASLVKKAHREILDHERKRRVELKCMELQEMMEEQGYSEEEIRQKVGTFRQMLMEKEGVLTREDQHGRQIGDSSSQLRKEKKKKTGKKHRRDRYLLLHVRPVPFHSLFSPCRSHSNSPARRSHRHSSCSTHSASLSSDYSDSKSPKRANVRRVIGGVAYVMKVSGLGVALNGLRVRQSSDDLGLIQWSFRVKERHHRGRPHSCSQSPVKRSRHNSERKKSLTRSSSWSSSGSLSKSRSRSREKRAARSRTRSLSQKKNASREKDNEPRTRHSDTDPARARRRSRSYSPIRKRRRDSPSFMEPRRITR
uniref:Serine/arginine repetitive matrix 3 n=1 Tax=Sphenodon punctatus TaxID=8508 RepID=A0A8D0GMJ5_SPHPU